MGLANQHPALSWKLFTENIETLKVPMQPFGDFMVAQVSPEVYWHAPSLGEVEAWVRAHVPAEMAPNIARGMEAARFKLSERQALVQATDAWFAADPTRAAKP